MIKLFPSLALACASLLAVAGCRSTIDKQSELERVTKDWCLTIRASQVMPVYPLTQDLQPGDVFLVQLPIDQQQRIWDDKGYLPLDNHVVRLDPASYAAFYDYSFPIADGELVPRKYIAGEESWKSAPHAAFPSYSFSVRKGASLNLGIPISGVPVGLGLLGADSADCSVSIGAARTLGIDMVSLFGELRAWCAENRDFLSYFPSTPQDRRYLRVVARIYLTGELDVSIRDTSERAAGLDAGVASPLEAILSKLPEGDGGAAAAAAENYEKALASINSGVQASLAGAPGGSLRLTSASARAVGMRETFDPPLVLGYLGFDCEIRPGGVLGPPVATLAVLDGKLPGLALLSATRTTAPYGAAVMRDVYKWLAARNDPQDRAVLAELDDLGRFVPATWTRWSSAPGVDLVEESRRASEFDPSFSGYERFRAWRGDLETSVDVLQRALAKDSFVLQRDGASVTVAKGSEEARALAEQLAGVRRELDDPLLAERRSAAESAAVDALVSFLYTGR